MPRPKLTTDQIASIPARLAQPGTTIETLAAEFKVHRRAIHYHANGGKATEAMRKLNLLPWLPHLRDGRRALRNNDRATAAAHFWKAAELLATHT